MIKHYLFDFPHMHNVVLASATSNILRKYFSGIEMMGHGQTGRNDPAY